MFFKNQYSFFEIYTFNEQQLPQHLHKTFVDFFLKLKNILHSLKAVDWNTSNALKHYCEKYIYSCTLM